jgi:hypothetical protein
MAPESDLLGSGCLTWYWLHRGDERGRGKASMGPKQPITTPLLLVQQRADTKAYQMAAAMGDDSLQHACVVQSVQ